MKEIIINARFLTQKVTGVQRFAIEISKRLINIYPNIKFVAPNRIINHEVAKELKVETFGNFSGHLWEQFELPFYLKKKQNPLLINLANTAPLAYNNFIATIHDVSFLLFPKSYSKKFYLYYKFLIPKIARKAHIIITVSETSKKNIGDALGINSKKITVINNAVSEAFADIPNNSPSIYSKYILSVSSFNPIKNLKNLIAAFNQLDDHEIYLVIVGAINQSFAKENFDLGKNKNIIFKGHVSSEHELALLYKNATLFVLPSYYESFGIPNLEAMVCGCPVVTSRGGALYEICGDAVFYIDPCDVNNITHGIQKVFKNISLQKELSLKGKERVKHFNWDLSANRLGELIREITI